jgi:hypothetical protein
MFCKLLREVPDKQPSKRSIKVFWNYSCTKQKQHNTKQLNLSDKGLRYYGKIYLSHGMNKQHS